MSGVAPAAVRDALHSARAALDRAEETAAAEIAKARTRMTAEVVDAMLRERIAALEAEVAYLRGEGEPVVFAGYTGQRKTILRALWDAKGAVGKDTLLRRLHRLDDEPEGAMESLRVQVCKIRRDLGPDAIETCGWSPDGGYRLTAAGRDILRQRIDAAAADTENSAERE